GQHQSSSGGCALANIVTQHDKTCYRHKSLVQKMALWTLVPGLSYDDKNHNGDYKSFTQFVSRSFLSNKAPVLEHLHLSLGHGCPFEDIGLWINLALSRHVRELHIHIRSSKKGSLTLPSSLYTSETLQSLTLIKCVSLDVPVHVRLPSLKTLSLGFVTYADMSLQRLLSGCPDLEALSVEHRSEDSPMGYICPTTKHVGPTHKFLKALTSVRRLKLWITRPEKLGWGSRFSNSGRKIPTGWKPPSSVPECLLHSLEAFEWLRYRGRHGDKEMAAYVLKNATCLKTATFYPKSTHLGKKNRMIKELASELFD
ncbi:unnamed protein product, partial [Brassica oleracea]